MTSRLQKIARVFDLLLLSSGVLAGALMITIMTIVCVKVFMRYILGIGWIGVDQISGSLLLYITFLGAAWVLHREEHVSIDIIFSRLSPNAMRILTIITSIVCAIVCFVVFIYGTKEVIYSMSRGILVASELEIPRALNLFIIPVGCFLLFIQFLRRAISAAKSGAPTSKGNLEGVV